MLTLRAAWRQHRRYPPPSDRNDTCRTNQEGFQCLICMLMRLPSFGEVAPVIGIAAGHLICIIAPCQTSCLRLIASLLIIAEGSASFAYQFRAVISTMDPIGFIRGNWHPCGIFQEMMKNFQNIKLIPSETFVTGRGGSSVIVVLVPRAFQKYSTCMVYSDFLLRRPSVFVFVCVLVFVYLHV